MSISTRISAARHLGHTGGTLRGTWQLLRARASELVSRARVFASQVCSVLAMCVHLVEGGVHAAGRYVAKRLLQKMLMPEG